jgi:hypothetical protein
MGVSINQWISSAVAEKMSAQMTEEYLSERASRASRKKFDAVLAKVPVSNRMRPTPSLASRARRAGKKAG